MIWLLLAAVSILAGCRAFEPETVVVNKAPETYIIGAPMEEGGGYYHYHVYWYGSDQDGTVERFVWALTDTTVQDEDTTEDEEDVRFNPALDANHLSIGHWTTKTDSIFDFQIDQGSLTSYRLTLHMVAQDDFGDFDRTPARLLFFTNALGNPTLSFFRVDQHAAGNDTVALAFGATDTVGFKRSYLLTWRGSTPNIRGYDLDALQLVDTVEPFDDGLLGYQWMVLGELGGDRGWYPKKPLPASSDSFAYFGNVTSLYFRNDATGTDPFHADLGSSLVRLMVNSIDVAGVEVLPFEQEYQFVVNFDPQTYVLNYETDWAHPTADDADQVYPYYVRLNQQEPRDRIPFRYGDRVPDRTYVVVKALMREDPRDSVLASSTYQMGLEGYVKGVRQNLVGGTFSFATETSVLDLQPAWPKGQEGWYADTLGFLVGPRSTITMSLVAVDEHGRRDGTPAQMQFEVGYPPCVQCVEVTRVNGGSLYTPDLECNHAACFDGETVLYAVSSDAVAVPDNRTKLLPAGVISYYLAVHKISGSIKLVTQDQLDSYPLETYFHVPAKRYQMEFLLHGQDDARERWAAWEIAQNPYEQVRTRPGNYRMMSWRYQVDYECDAFGNIQDGGGVDNITQPTYGIEDEASDGLVIDTASGLWKLRVEIGIPTTLVDNGLATWLFYLRFINNYSEEEIAHILKYTTMQLGAGQIQVVGMDQTSCELSPNLRPARYNIFRQVRPVAVNQIESWRSCSDPGTALKIGIPMELGAMESNDGMPLVKPFRIVIRYPDGSEFAGFEDCMVDLSRAE